MRMGTMKPSTLFLSLAAALVSFALSLLAAGVAADGAYGVYCSFPIHSKELRCGDLLGDRKSVYEEYIQGCRNFYGRRGERCDLTEKDRLEMTVRQPQSMVNYSSTGFMKIPAPKEVQDLIFRHWETNKGSQTKETWPVGSIYTNHWVSAHLHGWS
jgi:prolyl 4-hydroxylase